MRLDRSLRHPGVVMNIQTEKKREKNFLICCIRMNFFGWFHSVSTKLHFPVCVCVCFWWFFLYQHSQKTAAITGYQFEQISIHLSTVYLILSVFSDSLAQTKSIRKRKGRKKNKKNGNDRMNIRIFSTEASN